MSLSTFGRIELCVFVLFLLFCASAALASSLTKLRKHEDDGTAVVASSIFFVIMLVAAIGLCAEMLINNPYQFIYPQVCGNALLYALACAMGFSDNEDSVKLNLFFTSLCILLAIAFIVSIFIHPAIPNEYIENDGKEFSVDHEIIESAEVISVNDAYEVSGRGIIGIFTISTDGCYRYYYRGEDGTIEQGEIDTSHGDKLYDDCVEGGDPPRIEIVQSYKGHYEVHNKQITRNVEQGSKIVWKELHVPKGSITYDYTFDLQ